MQVDIDQDDMFLIAPQGEFYDSDWAASDDDREGARPEQDGRKKKSLCKRICYALCPFTSIITVCAIYSVGKSFYWNYVPFILYMLKNDPKIAKLTGMSYEYIWTLAILNGILLTLVGYTFMFKMFIRCGPTKKLTDPGYTSTETEDEIFEMNGIQRDKIGIWYTYQQVADLCTLKYFERQGLIKKGKYNMSVDEENYGQLMSHEDMQKHIKAAILNQYGFAKNYMEALNIVSYRYCVQCQCLKVPRAHHCSVCGKCVMRMDHHCPWVGSCVGHKNYKIFIQFLIYNLVGLTSVYFTMGTFSRKYFVYNPTGKNQTIVDKYSQKYFQKYDPEGDSSIVAGASLAGMLVIVLIIFITQHAVFILTSYTSLEGHLLMEVNPFFLGERTIEAREFNEWQDRANNKIAHTYREKYTLMKQGVPEQDIQCVRKEPKKGCARFCLALRLIGSVSRRNFDQVFDDHLNLSWFLPISNSKEFHNGYEWKLKVYKDQNIEE